MILRAMLAAVTATLLLAACTSDMTTAATALNESGARAKTVAPAPSPLTDSISVSPLFIPAGTQATGTIKLAHPVPTGGVVIPLSTDLPLTITLPASVTAPAGATIVTFPIATHIGFPNSTTTAPVQAFVNGLWIETGANVVTGGSSPSPPSGALAAPALASPAADSRFAPATSITFDWSDVSGAASYTIQIDDSDTFGTPLILEQSVTGSQLSTSSLPTTPMWWRVRAVDANGAAGAWSNARRFEVKQ